MTLKRMKKEDSRKTHPKLNDKLMKNIRQKLITSYVMIQKTTSNTYFMLEETKLVNTIFKATISLQSEG